MEYKGGTIPTGFGFDIWILAKTFNIEIFLTKSEWALIGGSPYQPVERAFNKVGAAYKIREEGDGSVVFMVNFLDTHGFELTDAEIHEAYYNLRRTCDKETKIWLDSKYEGLPKTKDTLKELCLPPTRLAERTPKQRIELLMEALQLIKASEALAKLAKQAQQLLMG